MQNDENFKWPRRADCGVCQCLLAMMKFVKSSKGCALFVQRGFPARTDPANVHLAVS
jgi:hypothetical protein